MTISFKSLLGRFCLGQVDSRLSGIIDLDKNFQERDITTQCFKHDWKVLIGHRQTIKHSECQVIAICSKCAKLTSGFSEISD